MLLPSNVVRVHTGHFATAPGRGSSGHNGYLAIRLEAPQSGGVRGRASAHLLGRRAKYRQRSNSPRHQRGHSAQGGLFGGQPAILGIEVGIVEILVEFNSNIVSG
jgi:hypothetical protein